MRPTASSTDLKSETTTVEFGLDGSIYEIDLSPPDAAALRDALATFVTSARRKSVARAPATNPAELAATPSTEGWVKEVGELLDSQLHRLVEIDPAIADTNPAELAEQLVAAVPTRHDLDRLTGPFYDTAGLTKWLDVSRQALDDRTKKGTLLMCPLQDGTRVYPAWQFRNNRTTVPHLARVLKILRVGAESPWTVATWLRTPLSKLGGVDPVSWLDRGGEPEAVLTAARADADRWSR
jgi:Lsr2